MNSSGIWKLLLDGALRVKGARVDRDAFLASALKSAELLLVYSIQHTDIEK